MSDMEIIESEFLFYASDDGKTSIQILAQNETVWVTQKSMAKIFDTSRENVSMHLKNIFKDGELNQNSVCKKFLHTATDGKKYNTQYYNLDAIISVGYRVSSYKATQFRIWATTVLREYLIKGFSMDDDRLKQGNTLFGKDYFDELLDRIREIRASEKRLYLKVTEIYQQCSYDYDKNSPITSNFYGNVQNKLLFAVAGKTAAEIKKIRADYNLPHMGLNTWKNQNKDGKVTKKDAEIAKNYLTKEELDDLNRLVNMFLDFAENIAKKQTRMSMQDWVTKLDNFISFNEYEILRDFGSISKDMANEWAVEQYNIFKPIQNIQHKSDFEKVVGSIKSTGKLPPPKISNKDKVMSDFNNNLKAALDYNPKD